jgi:hypothetical protein
MSTKDTGGPAFPAMHFDLADNEHGMTLRDYFAIHSVQPGCGELASMAGYTYSSGAVWSGPDTRIARFDDWFGAMPLPERLELFARVKYAMADAMLKARNA